MIGSGPKPQHEFKPAPSEMRVLEFVCQGLGNADIATALGISRHTVKNHVSRMLLKFGLDTRTQLVLWAIKNGYFVMEPVAS